MHFIVPTFFVFCVLFLSGCGAPQVMEEVTGAQEVLAEEKMKEIPEEMRYPHVELPEEVRGIYWTAVTARSDRGQQLLGYMLETGLNTVVIDVKMDNGALQDLDTYREILDQLYEEEVYRIARVAVMRDGAFAYEHPDVALYAPGGGYWYDSIGSVWVDPASEKVADYAIELGEQLYEVGFDEIQYDYVRFASDGAVSSIVYPVYNASVETKVEVMQRFFERVGGSMREQGIPVSFDLFGMTFESHYDYNIGQRLADVLPYADWISPMVYPSHYPDGFKGLGNPALYPYEIVKWSLDSGTDLMLGVYAGSEEELRARWRPWIQDFDIGAVYTAELIDAQIQASRDAGASGWILWNARNVYEPANYR
jgi:hypothetical protein